MASSMQSRDIFNSVVANSINGSVSVYSQTTNDPPEPLNKLPNATEAMFNSYKNQDKPICLEKTRADLLREIYDWAEEQDERHIFWLSGLAGTGKTTIARTVARRYYDKQQLGASFFFSRGGGDVSHAGKFVTSIAVQLATHIPPFREHVCQAIAKNSNIESQSLGDQWQRLIIGPLSKLDANGCRSSYTLVIDALDECENNDNVRNIVQLLVEARSLQKVRLRVFLTSRFENSNRRKVGGVQNTERKDFALQNVSPSIVEEDIRLFLEHQFRLIAKDYRFHDNWPGEDVIARLVQSACGLFIWVATACRFIRGGAVRRIIRDRLNNILQGSKYASGPEEHLHHIYTTVLRSSSPATLSEEEKGTLSLQLRYVLGSIVVLLSPLSAQSLSRLLPLEDVVSEDDVEDILDGLHAILDIPETPTKPLRLHHPSFRDFLLGKQRSQNGEFCVDEKRAHAALANNCIRLMSASLKQDICNMGQPGAPVAKVCIDHVEKFLPPELQYACLYWIQHLQRSHIHLEDDNDVHRFLKEHFLHWLEALGWMRKISEGIHAISFLEVVTSAANCPNLKTFVYDMRRFAMHNRSAIEQAPLQVYWSALLFTPGKSAVMKQFAEVVPQQIKIIPEVEAEWNACLQTLEGHDSFITSVASSPDSASWASASLDSTVKIWDARSGTSLQTLVGHKEAVNCVAFSHSLTQLLLASASNDHTVKIWDAGSGICLQTLTGHADAIDSVAFSYDDPVWLASASIDDTIKIWNVSSGTCLRTLECSNSVISVAICKKSKLLASGESRFNRFYGGDRESCDSLVKIWDASNGACLHVLRGHVGSVCSVAFSYDSKLLASASGIGKIKIWDADKGTCLHTLEAHSGRVSSVAFSSNSMRLASACDYGRIKFWDASDGSLLQTLDDHTDHVKSVAFSSDSMQLASASTDGTMKIWDADSGAYPRVFETHDDYIYSMVFSNESKLLASASDDNYVRVWDTNSGACLHAVEVYSNVLLMKFSPDLTKLAVLVDSTIIIWDICSGVRIQTLLHQRIYSFRNFESIAFSSDSMQLMLACSAETLIWDACSGDFLEASKHYSKDGWPTDLPHDPSTQDHGLAFSKDKVWITRNSENLVWLPPEYRPSYSTVSEKFIGIGTEAGRLENLEDVSEAHQSSSLQPDMILKHQSNPPNNNTIEDLRTKLAAVIRPPGSPQEG
ncbi:hypothetical protein N0V90_011876 [Kalmusia sp. IMI 367209]|nr:hypothetical protein N0V90_011876 [Kalmusia sp. IMI 367209]